MKNRFFIPLVFGAHFLLSACSENKPLAYVPVPGYPAPRSIKLVEREESWKQRADRMMLANQVKEAPKSLLAATHTLKVRKVTKLHFKKTIRKISSQRKTKLNLVSLASPPKTHRKTLAVW